MIVGLWVLFCASSVHAKEPKTCPIKSVKQKIEFYVGSSIQSEKFSRSRLFNGVTIYTEKTPRITKEDIVSVSEPVVDSGMQSVNLTLSNVGTIKLYRISKQNILRYLAVFVDNQLISIPVIQAPIDGGLLTLSYAGTKEITETMMKLCP